MGLLLRPHAALGLLAWLAVGTLSSAPQCEALPLGVPSLDELAGEWVPATLQRDTPAISNWAGSVGTNVDVVDATSFIVPPYAGGGLCVCVLSSNESNRAIRPCYRSPTDTSPNPNRNTRWIHTQRQPPPCSACVWTGRTSPWAP